jgi:hypothetical protein
MSIFTKKNYRNNFKIIFLVQDDKNFLCSGGEEIRPGDSAFLKNGQKKCPNFDSPKKSWEKNEKLVSTCVGPVLKVFFRNLSKSPTLCSILFRF